MGSVENVICKMQLCYLDNNAHSSFHQSETVIGIGIRMDKKLHIYHCFHIHFLSVLPTAACLGQLGDGHKTLFFLLL